MRDILSQSDNLVDGPAISTNPSILQRLFKWAGYTLIALAVLALFYGAITYFALQSGMAIRAERVALNQQEEFAHQVALARAEIADQRYELAISRLDWVLAGDSQFEDAAALLLEAQAGLDALLTPTSTPTPLPTNTPEPEPEPTKTDPQLLTKSLKEIEALMTSGDFEKAINDIILFQTSYPNYERMKTDKMLYDAYVTQGLILLPGDQIELGLSYLEKARRLGNLPESVEGEVTLAELYVEGVVFYGVNWDAYLYYFRELCTYAPLFHDSCNQFYTGLVASGDELAATFDWCQAENRYLEAAALNITRDEAFNEKIEQVKEACLLAPAGNTFPITDTTSITSTVPITNTVPITDLGAIPLTLTIVPTVTTPDLP